MDCQTSKEHISQLLDNELSPELLPPLFQHLGNCEECRNYFVQTKSVHDAVKKLEYVAVPSEMDDKFAVLEMGEKKVSWINRKFTISVSSMFYSIGVAIIMTLFIYAVGIIQEKSLIAQYQQTMNFSWHNSAASHNSN